MKAHDLTLVAILAASLTAGKMVLSMIPNVEIVTFLLMSFTLLFGFKRAIMAAVVFVTIEVFIYGFGTWILGYYILWPMLIVITHFLAQRTRSEYAFAAVGSAFGFGFGLFFALFESIFYGIGYAIPYWISGIPFDIVHGVSNFILVLILFKPITQSIEQIKTRLHVR